MGQIIRKAFFFTIAILLTYPSKARDNNFINRLSAVISLKQVGNLAVDYPLLLKESSSGHYSSLANKDVPLNVSHQIENEGVNKVTLTVTVTAKENVFFHYDLLLKSEYKHQDCLFYMPGFWYRKNLRSPKGAPSFHTSDSWIVKEDRLSSPLTGIFDENSKKFITVNRIGPFESDALTAKPSGEVILWDKTSLGYTGFENVDGAASLSFGFPYTEAPKRYMRKLKLEPSIRTYQELKKGESISLVWQLSEGSANDYSDFIKKTWEYCWDTYLPQSVETSYSVERVKEVLSNYFLESFVDKYPLIYTSGAHIMVANCESNGHAEIGFLGRILLNAFNALEYGAQTDNDVLQKNAKRIFDSYLENGFTPNGFFREIVEFEKNTPEDDVFSIRRQSEGIYATLHYLNYENKRGNKHSEWDKCMKVLLDNLLELQHEDGSFPRKFRDDYTEIDKSGGSTSSATLPLVMGYKYFKDERYLEAAKKTAKYLESEIIAPADYFSSTLDAYCEDKEASLYAATACYYLALITKGEEQKHYMELCRKASYFALSWYYLWDVPFAKGQMLGDLGLKSRGYGNVSVENNHIDVFVFEFANVLRWLGKEYNEKRFTEAAELMYTSMRQLLPYEGHLCGVGRPGYHPEVIQHTNWDYGNNGKGFYNIDFAPGWVVASLWELFTPGRAEEFLLKE